MLITMMFIVFNQKSITFKFVLLILNKINMKKIILSLATIFAFGIASAQDKKESTGGQTSKGKWLIEANTGFGASHSSDTSMRLTSVDGNTAWNIGAEGGYFVMDDLAIKAGLGYGDSGVSGSDGVFSYKIGAKYYINSMIPVQADFNGASANGVSPMFLGLQGGYAIFLGSNVSIEPGLRYDFGMNQDAGDGDFNPFSVRIGFALHF